MQQIMIINRFDLYRGGALEEPFRPVKNFFKEERFFDCTSKGQYCFAEFC